MEDIKGNALHVGDRVRFYGVGPAYPSSDPVKDMKAYGVIVAIHPSDGVGETAEIRVGNAAKTWVRYGRDILKR